MPVLRIDLESDTHSGLLAVAKILEIRVEDVAEVAVDVFLDLYADGKLDFIPIPENLN